MAGPLVGVDSSSAILRGARSRQPEGNYVQGSVDSLTFRNNTARAVFCLGVLGHLNRTQIPAALSDIHRVLESGGESLLSFAKTQSLFSKR